MQFFTPKVSFLITVLFVSSALCENKYSRSANEKKEENVAFNGDFSTLEKPFRMNKLNILWSKAQQRLTNPKLKSLFSELKIQDKNELILKKLKSEGGDKDGAKENEMRKKLTVVMANYGLLEHFDDNTIRFKDHTPYSDKIDNQINKSLFKDKKLNMLWNKAEVSGFTAQELAALREEFQHHQDKIDQYYDILSDLDEGKKDGFKNALNEEELDKFNEISSQVETNEVSKDYLDKANLVRVKHRGLRDGFDRLHRITAKGPNNKEFIEPKVQGLWRMATAANFTTDELASLKVELQHYENRLLKLRHLQADHVSNLEQRRDKISAAGDKMDHFDDQQQMIKKHSRKVEKMHEDIEARIKQRHTEL